jgi:uncharacterized protein
MNERRKRRWVRYTLWSFAIVFVLGALACMSVVGLVAGNSSKRPDDLERELSPAARALVTAAWADLDRARIVDFHVHVVGVGAGGTGCEIHPKMLSWRHPWSRMQFLVYTQAARARDFERADAQYMERLEALTSAVPNHGRYVLLPFDRHYAADGATVPDECEMFTPNEYVERLAAARPELFVAACSVHPYRADALAELERCARAGARIVKWLPNSMGMDPADARCDAFYDKLAELDMALLTHAGRERAVDAEGAQELGNPLRLRRALDRGVKVIMAHCASDGVNFDLDDPAQPEVESFDLFLRMMEEPRYVGRLFGEISTLTQINRCGRPLETMLDRTDLHARLVNGSDYPLPAIDVMFSTRKLARMGYLTSDERALLNEIYEVNPLLFDFVLKRTVKHPKLGTHFARDVFLAPPELWRPN